MVGRSRLSSTSVRLPALSCWMLFGVVGIDGFIDVLLMASQFDVLFAS